MIWGQETITRTTVKIIDSMSAKETILLILLTTFFLFIVFKVMK